MRGRRNLGPAVLAFRKSYESETVSAAERQRELDAIAAFPRERMTVAPPKTVKDHDKAPAFLAMPALHGAWR